MTKVAASKKRVNLPPIMTLFSYVLNHLTLVFYMASMLKAVIFSLLLKFEAD